MKRKRESEDSAAVKKKKPKPCKTTLDKVIFVLKEHLKKPSGTVAICNCLKKTLSYDNSNAVKKALKMNAGGDLCQVGSKYWLAGVDVPEDDCPKVRIEESSGGSDEAHGVKAGDNVLIDYKLFLPMINAPDKFVEGGKRFHFQQSSGDVIKGFEQGVAGMREGEKRVLFVPWQLAYGKRGSKPDIPPEADLIFHITLLSIDKSM